MKISTRGRNAVKFMLDLADHDDGNPIRLKDVAQRQGISVKYMEQIVSLLQRNALVKSIKGPFGGYTLKYPPDQYTVRQILVATEGDLFPVECVGETCSSCADRESCVTHRIWEKLNMAINETLEDITLADLLDWQEEIVEVGHYVI